MLNAQGDDVLLSVRVQPRAGRDEVAGTRGDALLVRVKAPPVDGKANDAVCRVVAKAVGVPPTRVTVERGGGGRDKRLRIAGATVASVQRGLSR